MNSNKQAPCVNSILIDKHLAEQDKRDDMREDMETSFRNETSDIGDELICTVRTYASRYQVEKKYLLAVLFEDLEASL